MVHTFRRRARFACYRELRRTVRAVVNRIEMRAGDGSKDGDQHHEDRAGRRKDIDREIRPVLPTMDRQKTAALVNLPM